MTIRKIGILTSGGDTPGMNACIHHFTRTALSKGIVPLGIQKGYQGLIDGKIFELTFSQVEGISSKGGTILKTARCEDFKKKEGQRKAFENLKAFEVDALVVIGGDGSMKGAGVLSEMGVPVMCLPGTIDNDLPYTEYTIGFDSAVNCAITEIERIRDTMLSHERIAVVEVMGNQCGDIALYAGISSEAVYILVPEIKYDLNRICEKLLQNKITGENSNIIVMAEGAGDREKIAKHISDHTGLEIKTSILGYVQRGGAPTAFDRLLAFRMCSHVYELFEREQRNKAVGIKNNKIMDADLLSINNIKKKSNKKLYDFYNSIR